MPKATKKRLNRNLSITIVERSPDDLVGNGPAVPALVSMLKAKGMVKTLIHHIAYADRFGVEERGDTVTLNLPPTWPRPLKAALLLAYHLIYTYRFAKGSNVVLMNGGSTLLYLPVALAARLRRIPACFYSIDLEPMAAPEFVYRLIRRMSDAVFCLSRWLEKQNTEYGCRNVIYLPPFIDTDLFQFQPSHRLETRKELGLADDNIVIGYAGAITPNTGVHVLLEALARIKDRYPRARLMVMGTRRIESDYDLEDIVRRLGLEDRVRFIPPTEHSKVPRFLSGCDMLCSPMLDIPLTRASIPMKVMEYLAMGIPTVSSTVGEITQIMGDKVNGVPARGGDAEDVAHALIEIIEDLQGAREVAARGREYIISNYSSSVIGARMIKALNDIIDGRRWK